MPGTANPPRFLKRDAIARQAAQCPRRFTAEGDLRRWNQSEIGAVYEGETRCHARAWSQQRFKNKPMAKQSTTGFITEAEIKNS
jgi:hypothetical protein